MSVGNAKVMMKSDTVDAETQCDDSRVVLQKALSYAQQRARLAETVSSVSRSVSHQPMVVSFAMMGAGGGFHAPGAV